MGISNDPDITNDRSSRRFETRDLEVKGLRIRTGAKGSRSFVLRKRLGDRIANILIGHFKAGEFDVDQARAAAISLSHFLSEGHGRPRLDPIDRYPPTTFDGLFLQFRREKSSQRSWHEIERIFLQYILPRFGGRNVTEVRRSEISALIDDVAYGSRTPAPAMARAVAAQMSSFYSWAMRRIDDLDANPCKYIARPPRSPSRERILSDYELRNLWAVLDDEGDPWGAAIKLLVLTGQRRDEVFSASWTEIDLETSVWTIPGSRTKNAKTHLVPLVGIAEDIVASLTSRGCRAMLFPSKTNPDTGISGFSKAMARIRRKMTQRFGPTEHFTLHDLRRTMATGLQQLGVRIEVTEAVLNHRSGCRGGIVGVYQRHQYINEKRDALERWAREVSAVVGLQGPDVLAS